MSHKKIRTQNLGHFFQNAIFHADSHACLTKRFTIGFQFEQMPQSVFAHVQRRLE